MLWCLTVYLSLLVTNVVELFSSSVVELLRFLLKSSVSNTKISQVLSPLCISSCLLAEDREGVDRYPYVFKLVPEDKQRRTYYISSPSKSEMEVCKRNYTNIVPVKYICFSMVSV